MNVIGMRRRGRPSSGNNPTPAERETLRLVRAGMTNRQIADARGVSINTVRTQVASLIAKHGVDSRRGLRRKEDGVDETASLRCYFCRRPGNVVTYLVAGRDAYICDQCVDACTKIIAEARAKAAGQ